MRKLALLLLLPLASLAACSLLALPETLASPLLSVQIDKIDHTVAPIYGGLVLINDTIAITAVDSTRIENFSMGFSLQYRANVRFSAAYSLGEDTRFDVVLDTGLGPTGYYGVTVFFPAGGISLDAGQSFTFKVVFLLSDTIESSVKSINGTEEKVFTLDFPLYPSLGQDVATCNTTVLLPLDTKYVRDNFDFTASKSEPYVLNKTKITLPSFARESAEVSFIPDPEEAFACFSADTLNREITINPDGSLTTSDLFLLKSTNAFTVSKIRIPLPIGTTPDSVSAFDEQGKELSTNPLPSKNGTYEIAMTLVEGQRRSLLLTFNRGEDSFVASKAKSYTLALDLSGNLRIMPMIMNIEINFPEGAVIGILERDRFNLQRSVFQESLSLSLSNMTWLQDEQLLFTYSYSILWTSFRPTLWTAALVAVGSIVAYAWQRPKAPPTVSPVLVPRKALNEFVETYQERKRIVTELERMKQRVRKGKMSRRRYKVRKTTLENKFSTLSKSLTSIQDRIMRSGAKYADTMRQLEIAETELDSIEADIKRIEVR
ncbi:MAG: hypothetical protein NWE81_02545, partial [Candidatus Bathyarchaeota archaeon]|nr:hypothetical protein [Candidatus Bathyarchaeota archaeon]